MYSLDKPVPGPEYSRVTKLNNTVSPYLREQTAKQYILKIAIAALLSQVKARARRALLCVPKKPELTCQTDGEAATV